MRGSAANGRAGKGEMTWGVMRGDLARRRVIPGKFSSNAQWAADKDIETMPEAAFTVLISGFNRMSGGAASSVRLRNLACILRVGCVFPGHLEPGQMKPKPS